MKKFKNMKKMFLIIICLAVIMIILFLIDFKFFSQPKTYKRNGREIKYYSTLFGNDYVIENGKIERVAFPQQ